MLSFDLGCQMITDCSKLTIYMALFCWCSCINFFVPILYGNPWSKFRRITGPRFAIRKKLGIRLMILEWVWTGLVFVLRQNTILGFQYRASTQPRLKTFKIFLENEFWVGAPLLPNLPWSKHGWETHRIVTKQTISETLSINKFVPSQHFYK